MHQALLGISEHQHNIPMFQRAQGEWGSPLGTASSPCRAMPTGGPEESGACLKLEAQLEPEEVTDPPCPLL